MKMAIASSGLGHVTRGIEAWAVELFEALRERGEEVVLYAGGRVQKRQEEKETRGQGEVVVGCWERSSGQARSVVKLMPKWLGWRMGLGSGYAVEQTTFALRLLERLRRDRIDVLHVQDPLVALIVQRARALRLVRTVVILAHGTEESPQFLRKIEFVQHLAPLHAEQLRETGAWRPGWTTIPNFVDAQRWSKVREDGLALRSELGIPPEARIVLTAAAIKRRHKRIDYLLEEFASLLKSDEATERRSDDAGATYLVVAGGWEGPETDELVKRGREMLGERVRFLVRFPRERMAGVYGMTDLFVLCSLKEMMPMALLEATAAGLPCLVHRGSVGQWMIGPGGEAIDMSAAGVLAGAMRRWLADSDELREAGERARGHCARQFGRDRVVEQIVDYYGHVVAGSGTGCVRRAGDGEKQKARRHQARRHEGNESPALRASAPQGPMRLPLERGRRPLRIVHVCNGLSMGGMEKLLVEFARHADRERFCLHFVALRNSPRGGSGLSRTVLDEIEGLGWGVTILGEPEGVRLGLAPRLSRLFRALNADLVHTHNTKPLLYAAPAARLAGAGAVVHTRHGQRFGHRGRQTMLFRWASRLLDRMVCVSADSAAIAVAEGIAPARVCTIRNGVDLSRFAFTGGAADGPAVMVGRLSPAKDVATLLRAARLVVDQRDDFRLDIAGDGPCRVELKRLADELSLRRHVRLLGQVDDVPALLRRASMCVLSSLTEGIPLTLLEAMAVGLPVVATRVGGVPEVMAWEAKERRSDEATKGGVGSAPRTTPAAVRRADPAPHHSPVPGLLAAPGSPRELAEAMLRLWCDPALRAEMGRAGRARAQALFDVRAMVGRYEALYHEMLKSESIPVASCRLPVAGIAGSGNRQLVTGNSVTSGSPVPRAA